MSQNSLTLATSGTLSGLAAVEAINAALDTLNTLAGGASAPASPEAGQFWHDSTNNLLKIRSLDNTAWIIVGALDETNHLFSANVKAQPNLYGLIISNDTTTPATYIDVAMGGGFDSTAAYYMRLAASMRKNVTANWASGTGNGSLDTGSISAGSSSWGQYYHVHLIYNASTGAVDLLTSLSYTSPTLPSGYTYFVPIGAVLWTPSSAVGTFKQIKNKFLFSEINDLPTISGIPDTNAHLYTAGVPQGCTCEALIRVSMVVGTTTGVPEVTGRFSSPLEADVAPTGGSGPGNIGLSGYSSQAGTSSWQMYLFTNTSGQLRYRFSLAYGGCNFTGYTAGFDYPRGLQ